MPPHFPNEILLLLFSEFHLTTIIAARGVSRRWRNLLSLADIHPIRQSLLEMYLQIITEPWFLEGRPWVVEHLIPFDRQAYVQALLSQHDYLPEHFRFWVMEWPAKAAFGGVWPGLPEITRDEISPIAKDRGRGGWNLLDYTKPRVWTIKHINDDDKDETAFITEELVEPLPAIPTHYEPGAAAIWVMLDKGRYRDQVIHAMTKDEFIASESDHPETSFVVRWPNWIIYLWEHEVTPLRVRYRRLKEDHGEGWTDPNFVFPDEKRLPYVPWSPSLKPYIRPYPPHYP